MIPSPAAEAYLSLTMIPHAELAKSFTMIPAKSLTMIPIMLLARTPRVEVPEQGSLEVAPFLSLTMIPAFAVVPNAAAIMSVDKIRWVLFIIILLKSKGFDYIASNADAYYNLRAKPEPLPNGTANLLIYGEL